MVHFLYSDESEMAASCAARAINFNVDGLERRRSSCNCWNVSKDCSNPSILSSVHSRTFLFARKLNSTKSLCLCNGKLREKLILRQLCTCISSFFKHSLFNCCQKRIEKIITIAYTIHSKKSYLQMLCVEYRKVCIYLV